MYTLLRAFWRSVSHNEWICGGQPVLEYLLMVRCLFLQMLMNVQIPQPALVARVSILLVVTPVSALRILSWIPPELDALVRDCSLSYVQVKLHRGAARLNCLGVKSMERSLAECSFVTNGPIGNALVLSSNCLVIFYFLAFLCLRGQIQMYLKFLTFSRYFHAC